MALDGPGFVQGELTLYLKRETETDPERLADGGDKQETDGS